MAQSPQQPEVWERSHSVRFRGGRVLGHFSLQRRWPASPSLPGLPDVCPENPTSWAKWAVGHRGLEPRAPTCLISAQLEGVTQQALPGTRALLLVTSTSSRKNLVASVNASCSLCRKTKPFPQESSCLAPSPAPSGGSPRSCWGPLGRVSLSPCGVAACLTAMLHHNCGNETTLPTRWWHSSFIFHIPYRHHMCFGIPTGFGGGCEKRVFMSETHVVYCSISCVSRCTLLPVASKPH